MSYAVGPNVLKMAQITETPKMNKNYSSGKKNVSFIPRIKVYCKVIVYPTAIPTIIPIIQLANTKINDS